MANGELIMADEFLRMSVSHYSGAGIASNQVSTLLSLCQCLEHLGEIDAAIAVAAESLSCIENSADRDWCSHAHARVGWLAALSGESEKAEEHFVTADQLEVADDPDGDHLYSLDGYQWVDWLARSDRLRTALALASRGLKIARDNGWNWDAACCERQLGRIALTAGDSRKAGQHLAEAAAGFRDGDFLIELAVTLADQAAHARATADVDAAHQYAAEAIGIAAPRKMVLAQSGALAVRARIYASQAAGPAGRDHVARGRDAADAALRLATRHHLAWHEFDALQAHAALDEAEGIDHGWAGKALALHARLVPPGLDPDPLTTVERLVAEQESAAGPDQPAGGKAGGRWPRRRLRRGREL